jgi:hypothetical protein
MCDFDSLKKKWKAKNVEEVKQLINRLLSKKVISDAEGLAIQDKRKSIKNNYALMNRNKIVKKNDKTK